MYSDTNRALNTQPLLLTEVLLKIRRSVNGMLSPVGCTQNTFNPQLGCFIICLKPGTSYFSPLNLGTSLMAESKGELKSLLMRVSEESENVCLKLNVQKTKIMASGPITSWQIGKKWEQWQILGSNITVDNSHKIKRRLLLGRKAMTSLDSIAETSLCQQRSV